MTKKNWFFLIFLLLFFGSLYFFKIGVPSLFEEDEAKITEIAREITVTHQWINLQHNFEPSFHKPPLYTWLTAATFNVWKTNETAARLWAGVFGIFTILIVYFLGKNIYNDAVGKIAAIITGTSLLFIGLSRTGFVDTALTCFVSLTILWFLIGYQNPSKRYFLILAGLSSALGMLSKGPLGIILPGATIFLYLLLQKDLKFLIRYFKPICLGGILFLAVASPWWILETVLHGKTFLYALFGKYTVGIYTTPFQEHGEPFYFYLIVLFLGCLPWTFYTIYGFITAFYKKERSQSLLFLLWVGVVFILFSSATTKIPGYILPLLPALAILTSRGIEKLYQPNTQNNILLKILLPGLVAVLMGALLSASFFIKLDPQFMAILRPTQVMLIGWIVLSICAIIGGFLRSPKDNIPNGTYAILPFLGIAIIFVITAAYQILPFYEHYKPSKYIANTTKKLLPMPESATYYRYNVWQLSSLIFYTRHPISLLNTEQEVLNVLNSAQKSVIFMNTESYQQLKNKLPENTHYLACEKELTSISN